MQLISNHTFLIIVLIIIIILISLTNIYLIYKQNSLESNIKKDIQNLKKNINDVLINTNINENKLNENLKQLELNLKDNNLLDNERYEYIKKLEIDFNNRNENLKQLELNLKDNNLLDNERYEYIKKLEIDLNNNNLLDNQRYDYFNKTILDKSIPIGTIHFYAGTDIPLNYKICDGSKLLISEYTDLFKIIGKIYNKLDIDSTLYFNLPDLRGQFIRGLNTGRNLGSYENDSTKLPNNNFITSIQGGHQHTTDVQGNHQHVTDVQGHHTHWVSSATRDDGNGSGCMTFGQMYGLWADSGGYTNYDPGYPFGRNIGYSGNHTHTTNATGNHGHTTNITGNHDHTISGGDLETRPKNIALYYIIKVLI